MIKRPWALERLENSARRQCSTNATRSHGLHRTEKLSVDAGVGRASSNTPTPLATARMQIAAREIVLWTTPSEPPKALQASECSELLDPMRASCLILAQHQPGKFKRPWDPKVSGTQDFSIRVLPRRGSNHAAGFPSLGAPWFKFAWHCFFKAG